MRASFCKANLNHAEISRFANCMTAQEIPTEEPKPDFIAALALLQCGSG
jgi:hypothetical protein